MTVVRFFSSKYLKILKFGGGRYRTTWAESREVLVITISCNSFPYAMCEVLIN